LISFVTRRIRRFLSINSFILLERRFGFDDKLGGGGCRLRDGFDAFKDVHNGKLIL